MPSGGTLVNLLPHTVEKQHRACTAPAAGHCSLLPPCAPCLLSSPLAAPCVRAAQAKAYTTRVGAGPYPTEIFGEVRLIDVCLAAQISHQCSHNKNIAATVQGRPVHSRRTLPWPHIAVPALAI